MMDGDSTHITVPLNNWGRCPAMVKKETKIGFLEEVTIVDKSDERDWALTLLHFVICKAQNSN